MDIYAEIDLIKLGGKVEAIVKNSFRNYSAGDYSLAAEIGRQYAECKAKYYLTQDPEIKNKYKIEMDLQEYRMATIARTETYKASNAAYAALKEIGIIALETAIDVAVSMLTEFAKNK